MADDKRPEPFGDLEEPLEVTDPAGEQLTAADLPDQGDSYELVDTEAEEIEFADVQLDETPDQADPEDVVIDDPAQLAAAEQVAKKARSSRPVKRQAPLPTPEVDETPEVAPVEAPAESGTTDTSETAAQVVSRRPVRRVAPVADEQPAGRRPVRRTPVDKSEAGLATTSRRAAAANEQGAPQGRTTPAGFVNQSVGELRKVIWPTGEQLANYFAVVLVFVLFMVAFVGLLDFGFGWLLLRLFGK